MILTFYESHGGGVNNLAVALDEASGLRATSAKNQDHAIKTLKRKLAKQGRRNHMVRWLRSPPDERMTEHEN